MFGREGQGRIGLGSILAGGVGVFAFIFLSFFYYGTGMIYTPLFKHFFPHSMGWGVLKIFIFVFHFIFILGLSFLLLAWTGCTLIR